MSGSLFTLAMARLVLKMLGGELIPYTKFDGLIANRLMDEGIITIVPRGSKRSFRMIDPEGCRIYISQNYTSGMELEDWIEMKNCPDEVSRSEQVAKAGDSKLRYTRTFKGFLLNCYTPIAVSYTHLTLLRFMANHVCFLPCKALLFSCRITNIFVFLKML